MPNMGTAWYQRSFSSNIVSGLALQIQFFKWFGQTLVTSAGQRLGLKLASKETVIRVSKRLLGPEVYGSFFFEETSIL
jgi:hypothetical protein